jgi:hypothetical protein
MIAPMVLASQAQLAKRYLRALHPVTGNAAVGSIPVSDDADASSFIPAAPATLPTTHVTVHGDAELAEAPDADRTDSDRRGAVRTDPDQPVTGRGRPGPASGADGAERASDR